VTNVARRGRVVDRTGAAAPDVLGRLLSLTASLRRGTLKLVLAGAAAAALIGYALLRHGFPEGTGRGIATSLALLVVAAPPLVLGAFWVVLGELLELPDRIRRMPMETRAHAEHLGRLVREANARRGGWAIPRQIWRLARLSASSKDVLTPYVPILPLLSLPFLAAAALSAAAVVGEVVVAAVLLLVLTLT
jgi:hypothetical protein